MIGGDKMRRKGCSAVFFAAWLVFCLVLQGAGTDDAAAPAKEAPSLFQEGKSGASSLKLVSGIPVAYLEGTSEEIGQAYGELLGAPIRRLWDGYITVSASMSGGTARLIRESMQMDPHVPERYRAEMRALGKAIGYDYAKIMACNAYPDIYRKGGCSTFAATGKASKNERPLLARNLDFPGFGVLDKTTLVALFKPEGHKPFVSVAWPGASGVLSGMNGDGLCCAVMEVRRGAVTTKGMPSTFLFRRILEEASDLDEALAIVEKTKKVAPNNLMILDRKGRAAVAEIGPGFFQVRRGKDGILFATNHHRTGPEGPPRCRRYAVLEKYSRERKRPVDEEVLKRALLAVDQDLLTLQAMIFDPLALRIHLAVGRVPATRSDYKVLDFAKLLEN